MSEAKFILSRGKLLGQLKILEDLKLKVSYSYKTNREIGKELQELSDCDFSIHAEGELKDISDKSKIWFFLQAENVEKIQQILDLGVRNLVVDNEVDFRRILEAIRGLSGKINLSFRMKFQEHRVGSGKYPVYLSIDLDYIHRKSQNTSEWEIKSELIDSIPEDILERLDVVNLGGGLPSIYKSFTSNMFNYIFSKLEETAKWLSEKNIECYIEPGRFIAAPPVNLEVEIIQVYENNLIVNTTVYNCALDNFLTNTKMLVKEELDEPSEGEHYLIKGNSPTRDDIFRYHVKLKDPRVGDKLTFLNAGAYNYTTDFFGYKKLETKVIQ